MFLARVEWLPVTSRSHGCHITDKCKISIMIGICLYVVHRDERHAYIHMQLPSAIGIYVLAIIWLCVETQIDLHSPDWR